MLVMLVTGAFLLVVSWIVVAVGLALLFLSVRDGGMTIIVLSQVAEGCYE